MYQITIKLVRPNEMVEFPLLPEVADPSHMEHFNTTYESTGKHIYRYAEQLESPLERRLTVLWETKSAYDEYMTDPIIQEMRNNFSQVLTNLGITSEIESLTEI